MSAFQIDIAGERVVADGYEVRDCENCFFMQHDTDWGEYICNYYTDKDGYAQDLHDQWGNLPKGKPKFCEVKRLYIVLGE